MAQWTREQVFEFLRRGRDAGIPDEVLLQELRSRGLIGSQDTKPEAQQDAPEPAGIISEAAVEPVADSGTPSMSDLVEFGKQVAPHQWKTQLGGVMRALGDDLSFLGELGIGVAKKAADPLGVSSHLRLAKAVGAGPEGLPESLPSGVVDKVSGTVRGAGDALVANAVESAESDAAKEYLSFQGNVAEYYDMLVGGGLSMVKGAKDLNRLRKSLQNWDEFADVLESGFSALGKSDRVTEQIREATRLAAAKKGAIGNMGFLRKEALAEDYDRKITEELARRIEDIQVEEARRFAAQRAKERAPTWHSNVDESTEATIPKTGVGDLPPQPASRVPRAQSQFVPKVLADRMTYPSAGRLAKNDLTSPRALEGVGPLPKGGAAMVDEVVTPIERAKAAALADVDVRFGRLKSDVDEALNAQIDDILSGKADRFPDIDTHPVADDDIVAKFHKDHFAQPEEKEGMGRALANILGITTAKDKFLNAMSNRLAGADSLATRAMKSDAEKLQRWGLGMEAQVQHQRVNSRTAVAPVFYGTRDLRTGGFTGNSLVDHIKGLHQVADEAGVNRDMFVRDFESYLAAYRAPHLAGKGLDSSPGSLSEAAGVVRHLEGKYGAERMQGLANGYRDWVWRAVIQPLADAGILSQSRVEALAKEQKYYALFERATEEIKAAGFDLDKLAKQGKSAKRKGAIVHKISHGLRKDPGMRLKPIMESSADMAIRANYAATQQMLKNQIAEAAGIPEFAGEVIRVEGKLPKGLSTFEAMVDGQKIKYAATDDIIKSAESLDPVQFGLAMRGAKYFTDVFRAGSTLTPQFGFRNVIKDFTQASIYSVNSPVHLLSVVRAMPEMLSGMVLGKGGKYWKEYLANAGNMSGLVDMKPRNIGATIKGAAGLTTRRGRAKAFARKAINPLYPLAAISNALETMNRFPEYRAGRLKGKSPLRSAFEAQDITLNFSRAGDIGRRWNAVEAFSNAGLQDISKFYRALRDRPGPTFLRGIAHLTVPQFVNYAANRKDPDWQNLPEWQKMLFLHYKKEDGTFGRIPMPPGTLTLMFSYLPLKALQMVDEPDAEPAYQDEQYHLERFFEQMIQGSPLEFTPAAAYGEDRYMKDWLLNLAPTVIDPIATGPRFENRLPFFGGRPAVSPRLMELPPDQRVTPWTTSAAKIIAKAMPERAEIGPAEVDFYIGAYLGGLGRMAAQEMSGPFRQERIYKDVPQPIKSIPLGRDLYKGFISDRPIGPRSQPVSDFYNLAETMDKHKRYVDGWEKTGEADKIQDYMDKNPEARFAEDFLSFKRDLNKLWKERREGEEYFTEQNDLVGLEDHLDKYDMLITQMADSAMEYVHHGTEAVLRQGPLGDGRDTGVTLRERARALNTARVVGKKAAARTLVAADRLKAAKQSADYLNSEADILVSMIDEAREAGMSDPQIVRQLAAGGLPSAVIQSLLEGKAPSSW